MSPPRFTPEFKDEAVRQITERGYSVVSVPFSRLQIENQINLKNLGYVPI
jgi:hypothetical protein